ncbi:hypothetical protein R5R35_012794 [Gryllus longicercus]|uniref:Uncharacterized protein n=1 Tax=Gryllus longicercus TaxID=2509291 RepID=A0AAN9VNV4_9ORTH
MSYTLTLLLSTLPHFYSANPNFYFLHPICFLHLLALLPAPPGSVAVSPGGAAPSSCCARPVSVPPADAAATAGGVASYADLPRPAPPPLQPPGHGAPRRSAGLRLGCR